MRTNFLLSLSVVCFLGCAQQASLVLPAKAPTDNTIGTPSTIRKVMVLMSQGSERGAAISQDTINVERALLKHGIRIVSSGITARAANPTADATRLSDLERALILARDTGVDALLQISTFHSAHFERHLVNHDGKLELGKPSEWSDIVADEDWVNLQARLIAVADGEVLLSIDISQGSARSLPVDETVRILRHGRGSIDLASTERKDLAVQQVLDALVSHFQQPGSAAGGVGEP